MAESLWLCLLLGTALPSFLHTHGHGDVLLLVLQVVDGEIEAQALYFHSRNGMLLAEQQAN